MEKSEQEFQQLIDSQQSVLLATASADYEPECSYAPFVRDEHGIFFIFISEMATHTKHLLANPKASIMFIQPEAEADNLFARQRLILQCQSQEIIQSDSQYPVLVNEMQEKFGEVMSILRTLTDFHLFALIPTRGRFIQGFGRALDIETEQLARPK